MVPHNNVMTAKFKKFMTFCSFFYERTPYTHQNCTPTEKLFTRETTFIQPVLIQIPGFESTFIYARECMIKVFLMHAYYRTTVYKLSAGPTLSSVLLLKENHESTTVDGVNKCDILEAIINF